MFCEKCGAKLEEKALFCSECGEAVLPPVQPEEEPAVQEVTEAVEAAPEVAEAVEVAPAAEEAPAPAAPAKKEKKAKEKKVKEYKPRRKPHIVLRIGLQLLSFVLCLVLSVSLVATVLLADLNHIMSAGGMKQLVNAILTPASAPYRSAPVMGAAGVYREEAKPDDSFTVPGDLDISDIPEDILVGGNTEENMDSLVDWIYEQVSQNMEGEVPLSKEEFSEFISDSTISDYMAEKLAGYAEDFINGTQNTVITNEEVQQLLEENMALIEEKFDVQLSEEDKKELTVSMEQLLEKHDINTVIRDQVFTAVEDTINQSASVTGMTWEQLQPKLQALCSDTTLYTALGICGVLMLLLCLLNFYNVPAGLTWIAVPSIIIGTILTVPMLLLPTLLPLIGDAGAAAGALLQVVNSFVSVLLPFHGAVLLLGFVLLIISIAWRIIRANIDRKRRMAAAA